MLELIGVKTNVGYYVAENPNNNYNRTNIKSYLINGKHPENSFHPNWFFVEDVPKKITRMVPQPNINHRFELIPDAPGKNELPQSMPKSEVMEEVDGYCDWKEEFRHLKSLYVEKSDSQPPKEENVEFSFSIVVEVDDIKVSDFGYKVLKDRRWPHKGTKIIESKHVEHRLIDKMLFPSIVMPNLPSRLTSKQTYDIIREHVKQHIDGRYARITSDYGFCFEVKKIIELSNPIRTKKEILTANGKSYKHKKFREHLIKDRMITVFEMTTKEQNYNGYTPIKEFEGKDLQDLKKNIDTFLENLIARINEPLVDCPHCDGYGVINP